MTGKDCREGWHNLSQQEEDKDSCSPSMQLHSQGSHCREGIVPRQGKTRETMQRTKLHKNKMKLFSYNSHVIDASAYTHL